MTDTAIKAFGAVSIIWESNPDIWRQRSSYEWLLARLEQAGVPTDVTHFQEIQQKPKRLKSRDHLLDLLARSRFPSVTAPSRQPPLDIGFSGSKTEMTVTVQLSGPDWGACSAWLPRFLESVYSEKREGVGFGRTIHVSPQFPLPSLRPPRRHAFLVGEACLDAVTRSAFHPISKHNMKFFERCVTQFDVLATADPPEGVRRRLIDPDLLILEWAPPEATEAGLREGFLTKQRWLRKLFTMKPEPDFNEAGDKMSIPWGFMPHPHVTFYGESSGNAFQTMVPFGGKLDQDVIGKIRSWREQGMPDGKPLHDVTLLLPNREAAVSLKAAALEAGFQSVLYVGDNGFFWDPFPEGEWIADE